MTFQSQGKMTEPVHITPQPGVVSPHYHGAMEAPESPQHWIYMAGNAFLIMGALIEGFYGGRLNHR